MVEMKLERMDVFLPPEITKEDEENIKKIDGHCIIYDLGGDNKFLFGCCDIQWVILADRLGVPILCACPRCRRCTFAILRESLD